MDERVNQFDNENHSKSHHDPDESILTNLVWWRPLQDNWKYVRSATRRLVLHDLADETELGILSFAAGGSVTIHTQDVANLSLAGSREKVASQIPVYLRDAVSSVQESCLTCAVHSALTVIIHPHSTDQLIHGMLMASIIMTHPIHVEFIMISYFPWN